MRLRHGQKHEHCFYWIVCSTDKFKKVNPALLTDQNIVEVEPVNCTTYMCLNWGSIYVWGFLELSSMESTIPTDWYFLACFCLVCKLFKSDLSINYESYFRHFEICGQCLNIKIYFSLSYIVKLISTGGHFFSYVLLLNKLYGLGFFKDRLPARMTS